MPNIAKSVSIFLLCALLPVSAIAAPQAEYMDLITRYVQRLNNIYDGTWAYTTTVDDKRRGEVRVRRIDPSQPDFRQRDRLVSVNGEPPSERRLAKHERQLERRERRRQRTGRREHEDPDRPYERPGLEKERFLAALVPGSIQLDRQDGDLLYLRFRAMEEGREKVFENLRGMLVLDTREEYIKELRLTPAGPIHPFFLTTVDDAYLSVRFELIDGEPFQTSATWRLLGQALIVKNLDADMEVTWEDFEKVQPAVELTAVEGDDE
ncbi:MAG: hypothetical protein ACO1PZ_02960 [Gammaproteobacteria bacterium]